ncbi:KinB-signaling pathway activation protein [Lederbergia galactosidilytica]|uniref:KinB-signaling pathway activation protein n=1 Tax=Lederbergia galactosidilytica TaxID=217031 RepID=A0A177ZM70_9BACI|nr:KinB-signaling pathway activation protein [Lederbergia galactosidilytica]MBP1914466.1 KinB signaling pathway activation protein [Lederbergia galactosidilytica]OAK69046.1 KinB-signaling pathway activation protein [Lederbergia galactosidilytica]
MTIRNLIKFLFNSLLLGGIITGILGFLIRWNEFQPYFTEIKIGAILSTFIWLVGVGLIFAVVSQVGFFAYLFIHQFGLGIFRSITLWNAVQIVLIVFVLFDLIYFRFQAFAGKGESILPYVGLALFLLIAALIVAFFKAKTTNRTTFVSALFFMVVVTILEWLPVLRVNEASWVYLMIFPLIACNAYQILMLPKYNKLSAEERERKSSTKNIAKTQPKKQTPKASR